MGLEPITLLSLFGKLLATTNAGCQVSEPLVVFRHHEIRFGRFQGTKLQYTGCPLEIGEATMI